MKPLFKAGPFKLRRWLLHFELVFNPQDTWIGAHWRWRRKHFFSVLIGLLPTLLLYFACEKADDL
jgi:hypothetical protein